MLCKEVTPGLRWADGRVNNDKAVVVIATVRIEI